jgi:hypothetical protein
VSYHWSILTTPGCHFSYSDISLGVSNVLPTRIDQANPCFQTVTFLEARTAKKGLTGKRVFTNVTSANSEALSYFGI